MEIMDIMDYLIYTVQAEDPNKTLYSVDIDRNKGIYYKYQSDDNGYCTRLIYIYFSKNHFGWNEETIKEYLDSTFLIDKE